MDSHKELEVGVSLRAGVRRWFLPVLMVLLWLTTVSVAAGATVNTHIVRPGAAGDVLVPVNGLSAPSVPFAVTWAAAGQGVWYHPPHTKPENSVSIPPSRW